MPWSDMQRVALAQDKHGAKRQACRERIGGPRAGPVSLLRNPARRRSARDAIPGVTAPDEARSSPELSVGPWQVCMCMAVAGEKHRRRQGLCR